MGPGALCLTPMPDMNQLEFISVSFLLEVSMHTCNPLEFVISYINEKKIIKRFQTKLGSVLV